MAKVTYDEAISHILESEGGYSNDAGDPGGPTNWGITIFDARMYWKKDATASDVRAMPLQVAKDIYRAHYAIPMNYDALPPGVDYCLLDYGVNSGISWAAKVVQRIVGVPVDGKIGLITVSSIRSANAATLINAICDERLEFLQGLRTWSTFGRGWSTRVRQVRAASLAMAQKYPLEPLAPPVIGVASNAAPPDVVERSAKAPPPTVTEVHTLPKSKSIWGGVISFITAQGGVLAGFFDKLDNPYTLTAFIIIVLLISTGFYLVIKGRIDIQGILQHTDATPE